MEATSPLSNQYHLTIRPKSGWVPLKLAEIWEFRDLLFMLGLRDVKLRYKQTILGAGWVLLQPLLGAGIFTFVFGVLAGMGSEDDAVPYFLVTFVGMLGWIVFSSTVTKASSSLVGNAPLVSKVYFPRVILPLSTVFATLIDFVVALALAAVLMILFGVNPGMRVFLVPLWLILLLAFSLGIGLLSASLMVSYRDVRYVLPVLVQSVQWISPVGWEMARLEQNEKVPEIVQTLYVLLNPLAGLLEAFRWSLLKRGELDTSTVVYSAVVSVLVLGAGMFLFKRMEQRFADVI